MTRINAVFLKSFWVQEVPFGLVNGTNVAFVLSKALLESESSVDNTVSGSKIVSTAAPLVGQTVRVSYIHARGE